MPGSTLYSVGSSAYDYSLSRTDFALPAQIRREIMLQNNNYPNEETELFDDQEEHILRVWKRLFRERRDAKAAAAAAPSSRTTHKVTKKPQLASPPLPLSPPRPPRPPRSPQSPNNNNNNKKNSIPPTRIQKLAEKRAEALRPYIRQYVANVDGDVNANRDGDGRAAAASSLEGLVGRLAEMLFAARTFLAHDVYAVLTYEQDSGWPRAEIWMRQGGSSTPRAVNAALEHTKGLLWSLAEEASGGGGTDTGGGGGGGSAGKGGGELLPEILRFCWHICSSDGKTTTKAEWAWGDRSCHFGALDLVGCLADFPRGDLELGWFGPAENDGEPVETWLVNSYKKKSRGPVVCGGCCPPTTPKKRKGGEGEVEWEQLENMRRRERVVKRCLGLLSRLHSLRSSPKF